MGGFAKEYLFLSSLVRFWFLQKKCGVEYSAMTLYEI